MDKRKNRIDSVVDDLLELLPYEQDEVLRTVKRVRRALDKRNGEAKAVHQLVNGPITNETVENIVA